jgi:hypothetical protein
MATAMHPNQAAASAAASNNGMGDLKKILNSTGPIVDAVLLSAGEGVKDVKVDTTPKKQMVQEILGGPFTFLGQYEDEGIVLMVRREQLDALPANPHKLQPPFHEAAVRGDILALKVAPESLEDGEDTSVNKSNEEFFLNYTKNEYEKFAARTDIQTVTPTKTDAAMSEDDDEGEYSEEEEEEEEMEGESDSEDEEDEEGGFMAILMGQVLERFQQENGRVPDEQELKALESAIAQKLGGIGE